MKKNFAFVLAVVIMSACGGNNDSGTSTNQAETQANDITKDPDYQKGLQLITKNDCFTCHKIDEPLTGPPYRDVANKYAGYPDTIVSHLAKKVITGGMGVWGQTPMIAHPNLSQADAETMVRYVLLLKTPKQ
jgi:cytochrome c